ncbi:hypothetical protein H6F86_21250 [Phormidium sp. FACHB-592]|uniref:Uncharacterized protein n=1 Tax=Stenomitos frigidus AS-A4 TaxID=2933935 RepID=A0ABV0KFA8_9CYAN|nr:hypothetical protein [Phormidium sp. FACHB-592]MBD2076363.1 hypothetical protein [Phormidium sp. FACHB-592]
MLILAIFAASAIIVCAIALRDLQRQRQVRAAARAIAASAQSTQWAQKESRS